jgi:NAD(P)H-hydrate epimerase
MRVLNRQQMQEADRTTIDGGVSSVALMARAGKAAAATIVQRFGARAHGRISIFAGPGNNGGDGFVIAHELFDRAESVRIFFLGRRTDLNGDSRVHADALPPIVAIVYVASDSDWTHHRLSATDADLLIDALFGTGLTRPLAGLAAAIVADLNDAPVPVVSIDLPSGLSADRTDVPGPVVQADLTITFGAPKLPLAVTPACAYAGALVVADIGISPRVIEALPGPRVDWLEPEALRPLVRKRHVDSHKGQYGHVLVIGGSRGKIGAAGLAGMAALRAGAGLVTIATPETCWTTVAGFAPEAMTLPLPETIDGTIAEDALPAVLKFDADVIALGPGLGRSPSTTAFVRGLVEQCRLPLVIDADALNAIAGHVDLLEAHVSSDVVITPHPGEMARLAGTTIERVQSDRLGMALTFAARHRAHVVLKGHRTVIATPAGRAFVNPTGNPGMATAGTGDVLTGVIAASLATGRSAVDAATLGAYLHGLAGDLAAARDGETGLVASDVIAQLRLATRTLASEKDFGSPFFRGPAR